MNDERDHWDAVSGDDPATMIRHGDWSESIEADLAHLDAIGTDGPVLDLGCGIGRLSVGYARRHQVEVIGVDVSPLMLVRAQADELVTYLTCDGRTLPHLPMLGGAFSVLMFQHIPAVAQANYVSQVAERLQPDARFVFQTVVGDEHTFLSSQVRAEWPAEWCEEAGLTVDRTCAAGSGWLWVTARKARRASTSALV